MSDLYLAPQAPRLGDILADISQSEAAGVQVRGCSCDSRTCAPGDVFVAIAGEAFDGHAFVEQAVARGSVAIVAQRPVLATIPVYHVTDTREAFGRICQSLAGNPGQSLRTIGITGTNGKTTTTQLLASILRAAGRRTGTIGTLGCFDGLDWTPLDLTTPTAPELAHWLQRMKSNGCSHVVLEVSSHAVSQRRIAGLEFDAICLTNLRSDHLDYHHTIEAYHHAKLSLFGQLSTRGAAIVNVDDPRIFEHAPLLSGRVLSVSLRQQADVSARLLERCKSEQTFLLTCGKFSVPVRTTIIGDHHLYNCLVAAAAALAEGIDLQQIVRGLEAVQEIPGRLERIECGQPCGVYVDFAHTPDALAVALETIREVTVGRLLCVFGAGGNRDATKRPAMGRTVESLADLAIVTTDNPRFEEPRTIAADVIAGLAEPANARWIPDRREAIHYALSLAGPDDCVLIAGRGHEAFQIIGHERLPLDDRELAREFLRNLRPASSYGALATVSHS